MAEGQGGGGKDNCGQGEEEAAALAEEVSRRHAMGFGTGSIIPSRMKATREVGTLENVKRRWKATQVKGRPRAKVSGNQRASVAPDQSVQHGGREGQGRLNCSLSIAFYSIHLSSSIVIFLIGTQQLDSLGNCQCRLNFLLY